MRLEITSKDFKNLTAEDRLKLFASIYQLFQLSDCSVSLGCADFENEDELSTWLKGNWQILQESDRMYVI